jgi:hypothetical protein
MDHAYVLETTLSEQNEMMEKLIQNFHARDDRLAEELKASREQQQDW